MAGKDKKKKKKIVKASDASFIKSKLKKMGMELSEDKKTKALKKDSRLGAEMELGRRVKNLRKAYKDKIIRDDIKDTSGDTSGYYELFGGEGPEDGKISEIRKTKKKNMGGAIMKARGGTFKGTY